MQRDVLVDLEVDDLASKVGAATFSRGARYAQQGAVEQALWNRTADVLLGSVRGGGGDLYAATARFTPGRGSALRFAAGECSCPVGFDCKHIVALVLTAAGAGRTPARPDVPTGGDRGGESWTRLLGSLVEAQPIDRLTGAPGGTPLAVELTLSAPVAGPRRPWSSPARSDPKLLARLVRPGRGGWVGGGLSWTKVTTPGHSTEYRPQHVRLLRDLYALHRAGAPGYYPYGEDKAIDLSTFESGQLWPLLDEATDAGLRLVHGRKWLGALDRYGAAEVCLDITQDEVTGALAISPVIAVDGEPVGAVPVLFIGRQGQGLVYVDQADQARTADRADWRLRLARLARPVPEQVQRLALDRQGIPVPAEGQRSFREGFYPRLRHAARVISSDGSFTPPAISGPTLVVQARYGTGHELDLDWEWAYEIGDSRLRVPLDADVDAGFRDLAAERAVLSRFDTVLGQFSPDRPYGPDGPPPSRLTGSATMLFSTEVLPLLDGEDGVLVEVVGEPAAYREVGDSLRVGVSTREIAGETDWFDLGITISVEGREVPFAAVFVALSRDEPHLLLSDGAYFSLEKPELRALRQLIDEARALADEPAGALRISRFQAGLWEELAGLGVVESQAREWQRQVDGLLALDHVAPVAAPASLSAQLRPYQAEGFSWLAFLWKHRLGGILADDMGLGKTLQSLALICHAREAEPGAAPFLIVAPTSVVANWAAEAARFAPGLVAVPILDTLRRRGQSIAEVVAGVDVVITSYTLFRLDFEDYAARDWSGLLLDEAQFVKNHQSKAYQCARRLPAPVKLALTGTPMENNLMELWALLSIGAPGLFPSPQRFRDYYARPIEKGTDSELLAQLRRRIKPLVKRRTKEQVAADLPAKQEQTIELELHPKHRVIYQRHLQRERQKVLGLVDDFDRNRFTILRSLTLLRQLSLHAGLIDDEHREVPSSKIDALCAHLLDVVDGGHRALVFSQFTGFLDKVRESLDGAAVDYCYLDGRTRNRARVIDRFKAGSVPVFLISLKAGGFGLNLTEADYCFLLDPWWNPATEAQAVDRTHRIGQTRNVMVYRLIAKDTIEEKVMVLKARKAELFASVIDDGNAFAGRLDADDIRGLFA
jgi:superfamily II DNA or RNA helicase